MDLEQWTAGGRGFGAIFVFLLMAGEIYSMFTFLGGAGLVYGSGGAAYSILGHHTLADILSYWLLPAVWRYATPRNLLSQADFFVSKYDSRALGVIVSVVAVASGIHGSAWTAAIKDILTLSVVVFIGLYLPIHYFGSIGAMFHQGRSRARAPSSGRLPPRPTPTGCARGARRARAGTARLTSAGGCRPGVSHSAAPRHTRWRHRPPWWP
jgi:Na+/proline symporter